MKGNTHNSTACNWILFKNIQMMPAVPPWTRVSWFNVIFGCELEGCVDTRRDKTWPINTNRTNSPASSITRERRNVTCSILYATFHLYSCLTHTPPSIFTQCHIQERLSNVRKPKVDLHVLSTPESSLYQHLQQHAVFLTLVSSAKCICTQSCWKKNAWCLKELQTCSANQ